MGEGELTARMLAERRRRGWSMRQAAAAAGVSNTTWSRAEAGAAKMTPHMLQAVATAFDWPADWWERPAANHRDERIYATVAELRDLQRQVVRLAGEATTRDGDASVRQLEQAVDGLAAKVVETIEWWTEEQRQVVGRLEQLAHRVHELEAHGAP